MGSGKMDSETLEEVETLEDKMRRLNVEERPSDESWQKKAELTERVDLVHKNQENRYAQALMKSCVKTCTQNGIDIFAVPLTKVEGGETTFERYAFNGELNGKGSGHLPSSGQNKQKRTILIIGATGSGKTTLINAMINYIFDVKWEDSFGLVLLPVSR